VNRDVLVILLRADIRETAENVVLFAISKGDDLFQFPNPDDRVVLAPDAILQCERLAWRRSVRGELKMRLGNSIRYALNVCRMNDRKPKLQAVL